METIGEILTHALDQSPTILSRPELLVRSCLDPRESQPSDCFQYHYCVTSALLFWSSVNLHSVCPTSALYLTDWSGQVYLVQPRVLSKEDSAWSFPGGGRLILSIDLKDGACTPVPEHVPASYVNTIKGAWRADEGRTRLENAKSEGLVYK